MHIFNKILLALIFVTGAVYFVFLANRFKLGKEWEEKIAGKEGQIKTAAAGVDGSKTSLFGAPLKEGEAWEWEKVGLIAQKRKIDSLIPSKVWTKCTPLVQSGAESDNKSEVVVSFRTDSARSYQDKKLGDHNLLYIFEGGSAAPEGKSEGGSDDSAPRQEETASDQPVRFLGMFIATKIEPESAPNADPNAEAAPAAFVYEARSGGFVDAVRKAQICQSVQEGRNWIVYEDSLPVDSPKDIAHWYNQEKNREIFKNAMGEAKFEVEEADKETEKYKLGYLGSGAYDYPETPDQDKEAFAREVVEDQLQNGRFSNHFALLISNKDRKLDELSFLVMRAEKSRENLLDVICDQLAMIGCDIPDLEETEEYKDLVSSKQYKELVLIDEKYDDIGSNLGNNWDKKNPDKMRSLLNRKKEKFNSVTFVAQMEQTEKNLQLMEYQRDLVQGRLEKAKKCVAQMESHIDGLVKENALLAKGIADFQFEASDQILQKADNVATLAVPAGTAGSR